MDIYMDLEFLEGTQAKKFLGIKYGETKPTIDLISIGLVNDADRSLYMISNEFNLEEAWNRYEEKININFNPHREECHYNPMYIKEYWIRDNVLKTLFKSICSDNGLDLEFDYINLSTLISIYGETNQNIKKAVVDFCDRKVTKLVSVKGEEIGDVLWFLEKDSYVEEWCKDHPGFTDETNEKETPHNFYTYYGSYDWVCFCWLFGRMIDLPNNFPIYTKDLKHMLDDLFKNKESDNFEEWLKDIKKDENFPKASNEHDALSDAKWNKRLHRFINNYKKQHEK